MYSDIKSIQILIALMKKFGIKNVVLSPGGSDIPIIHSLECDSFFSCYSVVDERSAAYFAMGIAQESNSPCACVCTSGTAVCNYIPGITEAFYQNVPVLVITADKNPYFQGQLETQKIEQEHAFSGVVKKELNLPIIRSQEDEWLCNRLVNEGLLAMNHHGYGPVHFNIPIVEDTNAYNCEMLPNERKIDIPSLNIQVWKNYAQKLVNKKIMVIVGQGVNFKEDDIEILNKFYKNNNCMFAVEHLSNLRCDGTIEYYRYTETHNMYGKDFLYPDIIISIGNNLSAYMLKPFLRKNYKNMDNWLVWESGEIRDAYKCLSTVFECSVMDFFRNINAVMEENLIKHTYYDLWKSELEKIETPDFDFSNFYVAEKLSRIIPENSILDTAILNSTRIMQFFDLPHNVKCYSNVGALGIDGCFSTFAGHAAIAKGLAFLVIGDLSFFYDMNAAGLRSIGSNVRVILLNNGGGSEFQFFVGKKNIETIDSYICAKHSNLAEGWIKSLGYDYYSAKNKEELDEILPKFGQNSDKPMFLEVFTDMEEDAEKTNNFYDVYRGADLTVRDEIKAAAKYIIPEKKLKKVKKILRVLRE